MRIAALPCPAFWLHRAEVRCRGPASTLWLTCSQRPNLTLWYPPDRVPGAWLELRVYLLNGCVVTAKEFIIVIHLILAISVLGRCWMCFEIPLGGNLERIRAGEMAQQSEALAATPRILSLIPRNHMVEGEHRLPQLSSDLHANIPWHTYTTKHRHYTYNM